MKRLVIVACGSAALSTPCARVAAGDPLTGHPVEPAARVTWNERGNHWAILLPAEVSDPGIAGLRRGLGLQPADALFVVKAPDLAPWAAFYDPTGRLSFISCGCVGRFSNCPIACSTADCAEEVQRPCGAQIVGTDECDTQAR